MENLKKELFLLSFVDSSIHPFLNLQNRLKSDMSFFLANIENEKNKIFEECNKKEQREINEAIKQDLKDYFSSILNSL